MRNIVLIGFIFLFQTSCQKNTKENQPTELTQAEQIKELEGVKYQNDACDANAGETWSQLYNSCVAVLTKAQKLIPVAADKDAQVIAAYILFNQDNTRAELFIPDDTNSIILEKNSEGFFQQANYQYDSNKGVLKINDKETYNIQK